MPRVTRQSAAHEAALESATATTPNTAAHGVTNSSSTLKSPIDNAVQPPTTKRGTRPKKAVTASKASRKPLVKAGEKRKRTTKAEPEEAFDINELPHGLGRLSENANVDEHASPDATESPPAKTEDGDTMITEEDATVVEDSAETVVGSDLVAAGELSVEKQEPKVAKDEAVNAKATQTRSNKPKAKHTKVELKNPKRTKKPNAYGVELGVTPYPDLAAPTPEQAHEVNRILSEVHGEVRAPKAIPLPSLTVAGCGEVPNILEALMRTLLSAHTTNKNAGTAVQGMIKKFGTVKSGHAKGNIDWNAVRLSSREEVEEAIRHGGLALGKSKNIWKIVEMVYNENDAMRKELAKDGVEVARVIEADDKSDTKDLKSKSAALFLSDPNVLTLDYMHVMSAEEAFAKFITFPGIGVKTASCTLLFCMQRPSFAVDTHVYRLCQYLGWVPMGATRDTTFAHCDVRIPDELKYSLHQLLIRHGKTCGRCRAITGETSEGWDKGCKLEHLVKRYGAKKGGEDKSAKKGGESKIPKKTAAKASAEGGANGTTKKKVETEDEEEDEEMDSPGDEEEEYSPVKKAKKLAKATKPKATKRKAPVKNVKTEVTNDNRMNDEDDDSMKGEDDDGVKQESENGPKNEDAPEPPNTVDAVMEDAELEDTGEGATQANVPLAASDAERNAEIAEIFAPIAKRAHKVKKEAAASKGKMPPRKRVKRA